MYFHKPEPVPGIVGLFYFYSNGNLMAGSNGRLLEAHRRFADEYLIDLNATQAYIRAGYSVTEDSAAAAASLLLRNNKVQSYLNERRTEIAHALGITQEAVVRQYQRLAFYDYRKMMTDAGEVKDTQDVEDDIAAAVVGVDVQEVWEGKGEDRRQTGFVKKVKFADKRQALNDLCAHLGWDKPKRIQVEDVTKTNAREQLADKIAHLASAVEASGSPERN